MVDLKPWARGPFELIRHAEGHMKAGSDFDKRMAIVSYDNAIEVAITTFLRLHPKQRGGQTFPKNKTQEWLANYHSKLEFLFEEYAKSLKQPLPFSLDEIIWYHNLRNELYHSGNGMVPEEDSLLGARRAAVWVFSVLFNVNAEELVQKQVDSVPSAATQSEFPAQMRFLQSFIELEKTLTSTLRALGTSEAHGRKSVGFRTVWDTFVARSRAIPPDLKLSVSNAIQVRNSLVHGLPISHTEEELAGLSSMLHKVAEYISNYAFSFDILPALKRRYSNWVRPDITSARIVQREDSVFLEIVSKTATSLDENLSRTDLSFIWGEDDKPFFSPARTADENAERFVRELDAYSIINCTDLFTPEGAQEVVRLHGPMQAP